MVIIIQVLSCHTLYFLEIFGGIRVYQQPSFKIIVVAIFEQIPGSGNHCASFVGIKKLFVFILICTMNSSSVDEKQFVQNNTVRRISYIFSLHIRYPSSSSSLKARKIMFACYRPRCVSAFKTCFRVSFSRCEDSFQNHCFEQTFVVFLVSFSLLHVHEIIVYRQKYKSLGFKVLHACVICYSYYYLCIKSHSLWGICYYVFKGNINLLVDLYYEFFFSMIQY